MGDGDEATLNVSGGFVLARENQSASCRVEVDGEGRFTAEARRPPVDGGTLLSAAEQDAGSGSGSGGAVEQDAGPGPGAGPGAGAGGAGGRELLGFGSRGRVWSGGAVVGFTCRRGAEGPFEVELRISGRPADGDQAVLGRLMRQYFDAARRQLRCEV
ncbi:hypothetical protein ACFWAR_32105 [Streptomyces sp. NPDC059917]|uniref:hypothetical protein n=1 Tax=Streptomyces sp. NPDC059917 TaxID=3347002 RepID=UPI003662DC0D